MPFEGIRTERLLIRPPTLDDVDALVRRRNDPWVAALCQWSLPYKREWAEQEIHATIAMGGLVTRRPYTATICDETGPIGDFVVLLSNDAKVCEITVAVDPEVVSKGYLREIEDAGIEHLFDVVGIERLEAEIDSRNGPSVRISERSGMLWEGHTRSSRWIDGQPFDNWVFGLLRSDWEAWHSRPRHRPDVVRLRPAETVSREALLGVTMHKSQEAHVGTQAEILADVALDGARLWAVEADDAVVGLAVVAGPVEGEATLRRLLVDRLHQRRGIGSAAVAALADELRNGEATTLVARWSDDWGTPGPFFEAVGFAVHGRPVDGVTTGRLALG